MLQENPQGQALARALRASSAFSKVMVPDGTGSGRLFSPTSLVCGERRREPGGHSRPPSGPAGDCAGCWSSQAAQRPWGGGDRAACARWQAGSSAMTAAESASGSSRFPPGLPRTPRRTRGTRPLPLTLEKCAALSAGSPRTPLGLAEPSPGEGQSAEGPGP